MLGLRGELEAGRVAGRALGARTRTKALHGVYTVAPSADASAKRCVREMHLMMT